MKRSAAPRARSGSASTSASLERPHALVAGDHRPALGDVERVVGLETPGAEADREIVGERVVAGEIEVDQPRQLLAEEEHVVVEEIGVDDAARQVFRPVRLRESASSAALSSRKCGATSSARASAAWNRGGQPSSESALARFSGKSAPARCMRASASPTSPQWRTLGRRIHKPSRKVTIVAGRPASSPSACAGAIAHRLRTGDAAPGQMLHQADEERQILRFHPFLVEGEDELAARSCAAGSWNSRPPRRCP